MSLVSIGDIHVDRVVELEFPAFVVREFFPACSPEILEAAKPQLGKLIQDDKLLMSFHSFIVRTGRYTILIDTCCGNDKSRPARPQFDMIKTNYMADLARAGVKPEEVDFVMCTHLHWDHVGWNTRLVDGRWVPTFPNARYIIAKREYDYWDALYQRKEDNIHVTGFEDSVLPIKRAEQAVLVADDYEFDKGIWLEPCHGHTLGAVVINVESKGQRGVFTGDVIHHQLQMLYPHLSCRADTDMAMSAVSRRALMEKHAGAGTIVMPAHFPMPTAGRIERDQDVFKFAGV